MADIEYPDADKVRVVMDNLSTHTASAVYQTFPARRGVPDLATSGVPLHTPHTSWLYIAEI